jgi:hypothetical protein
MYKSLSFFAMALATVAAHTASGEETAGLPIHVGRFEQAVHTPHTVDTGLPASDVRQVACDEQGTVYIRTPQGVAKRLDTAWSTVDEPGVVHDLLPLSSRLPDTRDCPGQPGEIRDVAQHDGEVAIAAEGGLFTQRGGIWAVVLPQDGSTRWAPVDVRAVAFDTEGRLWFASPQGVGCRLDSESWKLYTGREGLPFNDFTCMAAGPGGVWFGTTNGAIQFADGVWHFRQGRRWLVDNHVNDIAVGPDGSAWFATPGGLSQLSSMSTTLAEKAAHFEAEIDRYHRRTPFEYVADATLPAPGQKDGAAARDTDNDGHFTGIYLGSASLAYGVSRAPEQKEKARKAFEALAFLSEVTQGGSNPAPKGFIARAIRSTDGPDPNLTLNPETDRVRRDERDKLWKIMDPRWPVDESGEWYWKCDSSSDELDGYYFGFGIYYDQVCETEAERDALRVVVRRMTDHLLKHDLSMVDHDGQPTRWGHFSPTDLNRNEAWWFERGLNSLSILTYLQVAYHVTGDSKYRKAYLNLIEDHGYGMNLMTSPKIQFGPGSLGQADDNMAIMNYYHLIRYETDPKLLSMFYNSFHWYWNIEKYERNPFFNFVYAACCYGKTRTDQWGTRDLTPAMPWMEMAVDTLKRYPLDLIDWPMSNAHRIDLEYLGDHTRSPGTPVTGAGHQNDGLVYPIDENHAVYWGDDPWTLTSGGDGTRMRDPVSYLVAYYLGVLHGFIAG